ncbi:NmrA family NAD(P)-binding protein [Promicromonospora sp. NPDC060204]|uniref:NmrA family NAD(P)-binding protein n=1 Tax=Promicromonospora sp. NPDC060204 TaxID=3347071 RepID=UPI003652A6E5
MSNTSFFISGATGSTGARAARVLVAAGHDVHTLARHDDDRAARLRRDGVTVHIGDLHDLDAVRRAMNGVDGAYLVYPVAAGLIEVTALFAQAAVEAGVGAVVNMSQMPARIDAVSHSSRAHWVSERLLDRSGLAVTHLRPTLFTEWLLWATNPSGVIRLPFGGARHAPVSADEIGNVVAAVLLSPQGHAGKTYVLVGNTETTFADAVDEVATATGLAVRFEGIHIDQFADVARAMGGDHLLQHFTEISKDYRRGIFSGTSDVIADLTGEPAIGVGQYALRNKAAFARQLTPPQ